VGYINVSFCTILNLLYNIILPSLFTSSTPSNGPRPRPFGMDYDASIMRRWNIQKEEYNRVCTRFQEALISAKMWGERIQDDTAKKALEAVILKILGIKQFQSIFKRLDPEVLQGDLKFLAQTWNRNERRRRQRRKNRLAQEHQRSISTMSGATVSQSTALGLSPTSTLAVEMGSPVQVLSHQIPLEVPNFGSRTIVVRRPGGEGQTCRPCDFCTVKRSTEVIEVDDLIYDDFVTMLCSEVDYKSEQETISYRSACGQTIKIFNERAWRAALWDMYNQGKRHLVFTIEQRVA